MKYLLLSLFFGSNVYALNINEFTDSLYSIKSNSVNANKDYYDSHQIRIDDDQFLDKKFNDIKYKLEYSFGVTEYYATPNEDELRLNNIYMRSIAYDPHSSLPFLISNLSIEDIKKKWKAKSYIKVPYMIKNLVINKEIEQFYNTIIHLDSLPTNIDELFINASKVSPINDFNKIRYLLQYEDFYYLNTNNTERFYKKLELFYRYARNSQDSKEKSLLFYDIAQCFKDLKNLKDAVSSNLISNWYINITKPVNYPFDSIAKKEYDYTALNEIVHVLWEHLSYEKLTERLSFSYYYFGGGDYYERLWFNNISSSSLSEYILTKALIENKRLYSNKYVLTKEGQFKQMKILERINNILLQHDKNITPFSRSQAYQAIALYLINNYPKSPAVYRYRQYAFDWSLHDFETNSFVEIGNEFLDELFANNEYERALKYVDVMYECYGLNRINKFIYYPLYRKAIHNLQINDTVQFENSVRTIKNAIQDTTIDYCKSCGILALNNIEFSVAQINNDRCKMDSLALLISREKYIPIIEYTEFISGAEEFVTKLNVDELKKDVDIKKRELSILNTNLKTSERLLTSEKLKLRDTSQALANASGSLTSFRIENEKIKSENKILADSIESKKRELNTLDSVYTKKAEDYGKLEVKNNWTTAGAVLLAFVAIGYAVKERQERKEKIKAIKEAARYKSEFLQKRLNAHNMKGGLPSLVTNLGFLKYDTSKIGIENNKLHNKAIKLHGRSMMLKNYVVACIENSKVDQMSLKREIENANKYLKICNEANEYTVNLDFNSIPEHLLEIDFPANVLQPIFQNIMEHAFSIDDNIVIKQILMEVIEENNIKTLVISDNGIGVSNSLVNTLDDDNDNASISLQDIGKYLETLRILEKTSVIFKDTKEFIYDNPSGQGTIVKFKYIS